MAGMSFKGIDFVMAGITDNKGVLIADPDKGGLGEKGLPSGMATVMVLLLLTSLH